MLVLLHCVVSFIVCLLFGNFAGFSKSAAFLNCFVCFVILLCWFIDLFYYYYHYCVMLVGDPAVFGNCPVLICNSAVFRYNIVFFSDFAVPFSTSLLIAVLFKV